MKVKYDTYYQTENLFGKPYPELIDYYANVKAKGSLLDVGCGQGRDAIPLAKLGFDVTGIDNSKVGIGQLNKIAEEENLSLLAIVIDIYNYSRFAQFDYILLDSMFHFGKKEREKETKLLNRIIKESKQSTIITICIQKTSKKIEVLNSIITNRIELNLISRTEMLYKYEDSESGHSSETKYEMIIIKKV